MQSRPARLTLIALAWIAVGAATYLAFESHQEISARRAALRTFETTARDATDALDAAHASQRAYVALNQSPTEWFPKVATYLQTATSSIDALRASAWSTSARPALLEAAAAATDLGNVDTRVREALATGGQAIAAELIFADAADALSKAVSNLDAAQSAEQLSADSFELEKQRWALYALGGAGIFAALALALLGVAVPAPRTRTESGPSMEGTDDGAEHESDSETARSPGRLSLALDDAPAATVGQKAAPPASVKEQVPAADDRTLEALRSAADVCTGFGRVREAGEIRALLEQSAASMNARGLVVWLGSPKGDALRPVLAHGYSEQTLLKIPPIPREADNATAAAYRLGTMQMVKSQPGGAQGALAAPLLVADGCIGALTAELRDQGEQSEVVKALASIVAAQLAGVLQAAATTDETAETAEPAGDNENPAPEQQAASGGN